MHKLIFCCLLLSMGSGLMAQEKHLWAEPMTLGAGDTCIIQWKTPDSDSAYLQPFGKVKAGGEMRTTFQESTVVYLITISQNRLVYDSVKIVVTGQHSRGEADTLPNVNAYAWPLTFYKEREKAVQMIDDIFSLLQDDLGFSVAKTISSDSSIRFQTRLLQKKDLNQPTDRDNHIEYRVISYLIDVARTPASVRQYSITVRSIIQYKKAIYRALIDETGLADLYNRENQKIRLALK